MSGLVFQAWWCQSLTVQQSLVFTANLCRNMWWAGTSPWKLGHRALEAAAHHVFAKIGHGNWRLWCRMVQLCHHGARKANPGTCRRPVWEDHCTRKNSFTIQGELKILVLPLGRQGEDALIWSEDPLHHKKNGVLVPIVHKGLPMLKRVQCQDLGKCFSWGLYKI